MAFTVYRSYLIDRALLQCTPQNIVIDYHDAAGKIVQVTETYLRDELLSSKWQPRGLPDNAWTLRVREAAQGG